MATINRLKIFKNSLKKYPPPRNSSEGGGVFFACLLNNYAILFSISFACFREDDELTYLATYAFILMNCNQTLLNQVR